MEQSYKIGVAISMCAPLIRRKNLYLERKKEVYLKNKIKI